MWLKAVHASIYPKTVSVCQLPNIWGELAVNVSNRTLVRRWTVPTTKPKDKRSLQTCNWSKKNPIPTCWKIFKPKDKSFIYSKNITLKIFFLQIETVWSRFNWRKKIWEWSSTWNVSGRVDAATLFITIIGDTKARRWILKWLHTRLEGLWGWNSPQHVAWRICPFVGVMQCYESGCVYIIKYRRRKNDVMQTKYWTKSDKRKTTTVRRMLSKYFSTDVQIISLNWRSVSHTQAFSGPCGDVPVSM